MIMQWFSCSDSKKKKVKTIRQIAIELSSTVHVLENQALSTVPTNYGGFCAKLTPRGKSIDPCKSYWNPKRKMGVATHFER